MQINQCKVVKSREPLRRTTILTRCLLLQNIIIMRQVNANLNVLSLSLTVPYNRGLTATRKKYYFRSSHTYMWLPQGNNNDWVPGRQISSTVSDSKVAYLAPRFLAVIATFCWNNFLAVMLGFVCSE